MVFRKSLAVYEVPLIWCAVSARNSVGSASLEEIMRVIVTSGLPRIRPPDLNSYVCSLWGTLKGKCSMNNPLLLEGGEGRGGEELENSTRGKVNRHVSNKEFQGVSRNNFRTCEVCLGVGSHVGR